MDLPVIVRCGEDGQDRHSRLPSAGHVLDIPQIPPLLSSLGGPDCVASSQQAHRVPAAGQRSTRRQAAQVARGVGQIRHRAVSVDPYDVPELQAIVPDWIRSHLEIYTWRSAVPIVCFYMVHMHHVDRVLRQYGGEQPVPRAPVDLTRLMTATGRGEDRWWPGTLRAWYDGSPLQWLGGPLA
ncbi:hypothetical protein PIB30_107665 [Stylosanthes scabra]|uniref:Uncharacterized protein n=1 Tax=Stylosanthes scabra TaxID=79078 RepID=A0ABU6U1L1_9FABA|nr:hypothetical protein [Stylosanthes scabra]